jgi:hypothetical protein
MMKQDGSYKFEHNEQGLPEPVPQSGAAVQAYAPALLYASSGKSAAQQATTGEVPASGLS